MSIEKVLMPGLGESVHEASISAWLVKPGDHIDRYDPLAEAVSDKVTTEIPSDLEGEVKDFLIDLDMDVPIGTPIMEIEVAGGETVAVASAPAKAVAPVKAPEKKAKSGAKNKRYSPAVLELAEERGVDLAEVAGTGANGRITRKDVLNHQLKDAVMPAESAVKATPETVKPEAVPAVKGQTAPAAVKAPAETDSTADEIIPADGVRKAIARKMVQSATEIPHAWQVAEADVTNVVKLRNRMKESFKAQEGVSLSYFPFFVKAVVQALKKYPKLNSSWQDGSIVYHKNLNISIAVATEEHLYVPVIKNADQLSIKGLAKEIKRLADAVRSNKLDPSEMQDGTFTVNNTGTFGSIQSMGIINYPQAAILQVESINKRFVPAEDGGFKVCDMVNLCLSIDHRILDGLQAGRFLQEIRHNLSQFTDESCVY